MTFRKVPVIVVAAMCVAFSCATFAQSAAYSAQEACSFILGDFDYKDWKDRYLDYYDKWWDTSVTEADVLAYQAEEARKSDLYRPKHWRYDIRPVRVKKFEAAYGSDLTDQEKSALRATGWTRTNNPLLYFQKISEGLGRLKCDGVLGGDVLYSRSFFYLARECNSYLSAQDPIPCIDSYLGSTARQLGNFDLAYAEFEMAAREGSEEAMFQLAQMYELGEGRAADRDAAIDWYRSAGEAGHRQSGEILGDMYFSGNGVPADKSESVIWYSRALNWGESSNAKIAYTIGQILESEGNSPMAALCYARASIAGRDADDYVQDARAWLVERDRMWALARNNGITPYDEEIRAYGYEPINLKYNLRGVDPKKVLEPCKVTISAMVKEAFKLNAKNLADIWNNYGRS